MNTNKQLRTISLVIVIIVTLLWIVCRLVGIVFRLTDIVLPDMVIRIMGVLEIIAILVFVYTTVKLRNQK